MMPTGGITIESLQQMKQEFFKVHEMNYGYYNADAPIQFVNFRCEAIGVVQKPNLTELTDEMVDPSVAEICRRLVYFEESDLPIECPVYDRAKFGKTEKVNGPCIVEQMDSTTVIPPNTYFSVDKYGNLLVRTFASKKDGE